MKCIISPFDKCYLNIASEEYYMENFAENVFYLYINKPCVIIGRHQNAYLEINQDYVQKNDIDVVRRNSGGGAVYHDLGNLNYGFITKGGGKGINEVFREFTEPVLQVLNDLGVNAVFSGRNDLTIEGKKFSGNAQYRSKDKVLIHGTLLFSSDIEQVSKSLNADPRKFKDKSVKSVKSRVTNILPHLPSPIAVDEFTSIIIKRILSGFPDAYLYELTEQDKEQIETLARNKYSTREWIYGNSSVFNYSNTLKYDLGILDIGIQVESGFIKDIAVFGDFFGEKDLDEVLSMLRGLPFEKSAALEALHPVSLTEYIFGLSNETFVNCIFHIGE
jgi:lipoate-protein ligase A